VGSSTAAIATSGEECWAAFGGTERSRSGTEFLQHAPELATGAHFPFKQQLATWLRGAPAAKHSEGARNRIAAIRLTEM
jgi:hypothetical protein